MPVLSEYNLLSSPATFEGCQVKNPSLGGQPKLVAANANETLSGGFWASCEVNEIRLKLQQEPKCVVNGTQHRVGEMWRENTFQWICLETGRWVSGCYYQAEAGEWVLLKIGQVGYNGLIRHTCDRYKDNPGRVQYHAEVGGEPFVSGSCGDSLR
jgi:hypothetical protein